MTASELAPSGSSLFFFVAIAHALAVMSPGPDFAMVVRQTFARGRAAGIITALGIASGISVHVAYALFGLAWAIQEFPVLLIALRILGAMVLIWIGYAALRARPATSSAANTPLGVSENEKGRSWLSDFGIGFLTNVLNVKAMLFFVALCSTVIGANTSSTLKLALGAWMIGATAAWFCFIGATLGHPKIRSRLAGSAHWIDRAMGAILILLGLGILIALAI